MSEKLKLKPTKGFVLIEPVRLKQKTKTGIILPEIHDEKSQKGKVIAVGKAPMDEQGREILLEFDEGDMVIFKKWGGDEVKLDMTGKQYVFVKFEDILALVISRKMKLPKCLFCLKQIKKDEKKEAFFFRYNPPKEKDKNKETIKKEAENVINLSARWVHKVCFDELRETCFEEFVKRHNLKISKNG